MQLYNDEQDNKAKALCICVFSRNVIVSLTCYIIWCTFMLLMLWLKS